MLYMNEKKKIEIDHTQLVASESERLMKKYGKEYLDCKDLMQILGVGKDNVRALMRSKDFPTTQIGNRKVVSVLSFVIWQMKILS